MGRPKKVIEEEVKELTIHDKYRHYIDSVVKNNSISKINYDEAKEIHTWICDKINKNMGMNFGCGQCMIDLIRMFANLE